MNVISNADFYPKSPIYSNILCRTLSGLTGIAVAVIDAADSAISLSTLKNGNQTAPTYRTDTYHTDKATGILAGIGTKLLDPAEVTHLCDLVPADLAHPNRWHGFVASFDNGEVDQIAIHLACDKDKQRSHDLLSLIWPVLRESCLRETMAAQTAMGDEALLWMIASRIDLGVLVVNANGLILRTNHAAKSLLNQGVALRRGHGGLHGFDDHQTRNLRAAIAACANAGPASTETMVLLDTANGGPRVPVTLSRYLHDGQPTNLVVLLLPAPPDPRRVEKLAKDLGLTTAESRVAVQMQQGLSNRDAATCMGLTEQSVSTYAKRVLSKLNVNSRAEVAQLLTWQAHGGRI